MNVSDAFHRYAEKVCEQIRWKKAHSAVAQEIEDHLTDQKNAYLAAGDSESIAEEKALLQMGDPVSVGAALDQTHKPAPQWGIIGLVLLMFYAPFRYRYGWERLYTIFVPSGDPMGSGYLSTQLKTILSHCVLLGEGAALSETQAYLLTDASMLRSDYLLAYLTYHYGWVASGIVVLLLAVFLGLGFRKALKQKSIFGQMVSLTILCTFTAEILLYIPANLGIWLIAPIALPFLSYGATALLINMALAGVLLSVFRTGEVYRDTAPHPIFSDSKFIQWADGKLTISFK